MESTSKITEAQVGVMLVAVAGMYSTFQVSKKNTQLWHSLLRHLDYGLVEKAFRAHMLKSTFPPTTADIVKLAGQLAQPKQKTSGQLWLISKNVCLHGEDRHRDALREQYPAAWKALQQIGGWRRILQAESKDMPFIQRDWLKFYEEMKDHQKAQEHLQIAATPSAQNLLTAGGENERERKGREF